MFNDVEITHREELDTGDFERAEQLVRGGMSFDKALGYLRGWAADYAYERNADSRAASDFEDMAYGRD